MTTDQIIVCKYCREKVITNTTHRCKGSFRKSDLRDQYIPPDVIAWQPPDIEDAYSPGLSCEPVDDSGYDDCSGACDSGYSSCE